MRFLYIKVLQILNEMVYLMLRIVGHVPRVYVPRVSHLTGIFSQLWGGGTMQLMFPNANFGGVSLSPAGFTPLFLAAGQSQRLRSASGVDTHQRLKDGA